jgi:hypothetical protein
MLIIKGGLPAPDDPPQFADEPPPTPPFIARPAAAAAASIDWRRSTRWRWIWWVMKFFLIRKPNFFLFEIIL